MGAYSRVRGGGQDRHRGAFRSQLWLPAPGQLQPRPLRELADLLCVPISSIGPRRSAERLLSGVTHDSRRVLPGDLYVALPGSRRHGAEFTAAAAAAGAAAVLTDAAGSSRAAAAGLPALVVADPRARLGKVASFVYGNPSARLLM